MRLAKLIRGDIRFQIKYGFYFLYIVLTMLYAGLLFALPVEWRKTAAVLMIFSDPAAMGLFFMGAIVLFEKSERVLDSLAISPVRPYEYVLSKLSSIAFISTLTGLAIGLFGGIVTRPFYFVAGLFLCSCLFSALGLIVSAKIVSLNQFILATIPAEILVNVPAVVYIFGFKKPILLLHPGVCMIELCTGGQFALPALCILTAWTVVLAVFAMGVVDKMFKRVGGVRL